MGEVRDEHLGQRHVSPPGVRLRRPEDELAVLELVQLALDPQVALVEADVGAGEREQLPEPQPGEGGGGPMSGLEFQSASGTVSRSVGGPLERRRDLGGVSCTDWNAASDEDRAWLVSAIAAFVGGVVVDGEKAVGYGDVLTAQQANSLFDTSCRQSYGQGFLLYKLYSYAAVLTD